MSFADDMRAAMEAMRQRPYRACTHVVHPRYRGWQIADKPTDTLVRCANLCGWAAYMRPPS